MTEQQPPWDAVSPRQGLKGGALAAFIVSAYLANFVVLVFFLDVKTQWPIGIALGAFQIWCSVGLFIIAHDCMHGSLFPRRPNLGHWLGRACLLLYAGFPYDTLHQAHHAHHAHAGTAADPDFDENNPRSLPRWFATFVRTYFGWREFGILTVFLLSQIALGAPLENVLLFWAFPAQCSALQLFFFGTFLPHRQQDAPFADAHHSRTLPLPTWLSLLTCFHFGYHHEHHLYPFLPWWRLPRAHQHHRQLDSSRQVVPASAPSLR